MNRNWIALYGLLAGFSVAIYYFISGDRALALLFVFLGIYASCTLYYFLRILYYLENKATLNELFFYVGSMVIALLTVFLPKILSLSSPELAVISLQLPNGGANLLTITFFSMLALPYYLTFLIISFRCFTRYPYIRWGPYSEGGIHSELFGFASFFTFGLLSSWIGWNVNDFLTFLVGVFLLISGFVFLIAR